MKQLEEKRDLAEQSALKAFVNQQKSARGIEKNAVVTGRSNPSYGI